MNVPNGMIAVWTAIRAYVDVQRSRPKRSQPGWRSMAYGRRVLVFDIETTIDVLLRMLYGVFRLYERDHLVCEGIIVSDALTAAHQATIEEYGRRHRLPIFSRDEFVETVFYPEVYVRGTVCLGYNLAFDLFRIALGAGAGRDRNRRKFRLTLSKRARWPDIRVEAIAGKSAFFSFVPKKSLARWEKPFFAGRFLDASAAVRAFTGAPHRLRRAGKAYNAHTVKGKTDDLGTVTRSAITYCRQDVRATWALYLRLREEYALHPFATFANERDKPALCRYMGQLYSAASVAKGYLRLFGIRNIRDTQRSFDPAHFGRGMPAYFGGRAAVQVRRTPVPVRVLDFASMYPTVFILLRLQALLTARKIMAKTVTREVRSLLRDVTVTDLYRRDLWPSFNCLVLVEPNGAILPVRERFSPSEPYTIAVTHLTTSDLRWYTLADVLAAKIAGGPLPRIVRAVRYEARGSMVLSAVEFRGQIRIDSHDELFKAMVEQRQIAKAKGDKRIELGLKLVANSGSYGIPAEINVIPSSKKHPATGMVYADEVYKPVQLHDERPGELFNPLIAAFVTGGARLMLATLERAVADRRGTFVACDTDSLIVPVGSRRIRGVPSIPRAAIEKIIAAFDALNPYNRDVVPHVLKDESVFDDVRCYAISAKRYVLYRIRRGNRIQIVKASESGLGAIIGRTENETTRALARRIWLAILMSELRVNPQQRRRVAPLVNFDVPLRRRFPITQPHVLTRFRAYNATRSYDRQIKPFNFLQTVASALISGHEIIPIAPFEKDVRRSRHLQWYDFAHGQPVSLDWDGTCAAGTVPVKRLSEFVAEYACHPESKAADDNGRPAGPDARGVLARLHLYSGPAERIGKEVDRLEEDEGAVLLPQDPAQYCSPRDQALTRAIDDLRAYRQADVAAALAVSERRWRDIENGRAIPHKALREAIIMLAGAWRTSVPNGVRVTVRRSQKLYVRSER